MDSLLEIIDDKLLSWARDREKLRIVPIGTTTHQNEFPPGARVTRRLPRGPRRTLKGVRLSSNLDAPTASWPRDGLVEFAGVPLIICVFGGHVDYWAGESVVHCGEGYFLLLPPGIRHEGATPHYIYNPNTPDPNQFCNLFWIGRWGRTIRCWTCYSQGAVHASRTGMQTDFLNDTANTMLDTLMAEAMAGQPDWQVICRDCLSLLLTILRRDIVLGASLKLGRDCGAESGTATSGDPIEDATRFIQARLRDRLTIEKVARQIGMSRAQFTKGFRRQTGKSFNQYLTECRIEESKTLLLDSTMTLKAICHILGLRSHTYFSSLFTSQVGLSPQAFRNQRGILPSVEQGLVRKKPK